MTVQLIDDVAGTTLAAASDREIGAREGGKVAVAHAVGEAIAARAKEKGIVAAVFDRGGYAYHGRVQAVAEGARAGGLAF